MAVLGSGPAGFYTAYKVMSTIKNAVVDMFESLPVPFGLVRFGVAPDHPEVKVTCSLKISCLSVICVLLISCVFPLLSVFFSNHLLSELPRQI